MQKTPVVCRCQRKRQYGPLTWTVSLITVSVIVSVTFIHGWCKICLVARICYVFAPKKKICLLVAKVFDLSRWLVWLSKMQLALTFYYIDHGVLNACNKILCVGRSVSLIFFISCFFVPFKLIKFIWKKSKSMFWLCCKH